MDQANGENNPEPPPNIFVKRRRGRPRKDPSQGITRRVSAHVPPGFDGVNRSKSLWLDPIRDSASSMVGQPVTGVVEAAFDDGYFLSVRIGNSSTNFRGIVFKSGHYVPVSAENDVAPHVQMIRRNEISLPLVNQARTHGRHRRSRVRNARHVLETSTSIVPSMGSRGTMVPVVLQPVNVSNGVLFPNHVPQVSYQASHFADPRYVQLRPVVSNIRTFQSQASSNIAVSAGLQGQNDPFNSMNHGGALTPHVMQSEAGAAGQASGEDSDDVDEPLDVEPLQAIHSYVHNQSHPVQKPLEIKRLGKMTELLQAVQENVGGNQLLGAGNLTTQNDNPQV